MSAMNILTNTSLDVMKNNASKDELIKFAAWINKTYEN